MITLQTPNTNKPKFVSEVTMKDRQETKVVSISGKGDPLKTFDHKISEIFNWLGHGRIKAGYTLGIYYKNRNDIGLDNVDWDACVPVDKEIKTKGELKFQVLPKVKVASVTLTGGYDLIGPALKYLELATKINNIETHWPLTEIYIEEGKTPITELQYFVK